LGALQWPESFRNILRTPQHLMVFLNYLDADGLEAIDVSMSYQQMLDKLWERNVNSTRKRELIRTLTNRLTENEALWAPRSAFDDYQTEIAQLESDEVLKTEQLRIGFSHQTLLEHARARLFVQQQLSLSDFIIQRQDAIFVRPTAWHVLKYLREADPATYESEIQILFKQELRIHIRYLLIDFIGQQASPTEIEISLFAMKLSQNSDRNRILTAIRGNSNWFEAFKTTHFPPLMQLPVENSWAMLGVISMAWSFAKEDCLSLIENHWIGNPEKDRLSANAFQDLEEWDVRSEKLFITVIQRSEDSRLWWFQRIVERTIDEQPDLAIRILKAAIFREYENSSGVNPFDSGEPWYELPKIAEAAPTEFLIAFWDWSVAILSQFEKDTHSSLIRRYPETLIYFSDLREHERPLYSALEKAVELTA